jgi:hypothetical protein
MAINYSYPKIGALATGDLLMIVDISNDNRTNTLEIGDLSSYIITTSSLTNGSGTAAAIPKWSDADTLTDSVMSETATGINVTGDLTASNDLIAGRDLTVTRTANIGDLAATGSAVIGGNITGNNNVIALNNVSVGNDLSVVNDVSISNGLVVTGGTEVNALTINAALEDGSGTEGASGQILSSTGTATQWIDVEAQTFSSLTTTGTSGAATLVAGVLNVPQYVSSAPAYTSSFISISQSGTGEPTAAFLSNDAGLVLGTDTRMGTGEYYFTFTGTPPDEDNVMIVLPGGLRNGGYSFITLVSEYRNSGQLFINSYGVNGSGALIATDIGFGGSNSIIVEIRVFN